MISSRMWISYEIVGNKKYQQNLKTYLLGKVKDVMFLFPYNIFGLYFPGVTKEHEYNDLLLLDDF